LYQKDATFSENPHKVALSIFKGYIGFSSALRTYNLLEYEPTTIFIVTRNKSARKKLGVMTSNGFQWEKKRRELILFIKTRTTQLKPASIFTSIPELPVTYAD